MTKTELKTNWEKVLVILQESMDRLLVDSYYRPMKPIKISERDQKITFLTDISAAYHQVTINRHLKELTDAIEQVFGKPYEVVVTDEEPEEEETGSVQTEIENFDPKYTFESFVPGNNSRLAYMASYAVAEAFEKKFNPLFIYGGSGLGKTHLLHSIGLFVRRNRPRKKVLYVSSETFTNEYIQSVRRERDGMMDEFRKKYRSLDYLLFDDVQFLANKTETQTELFNTFEALYNAGKQIVFTSDRPPKDLGDIPDRLISRFSWGLIADIQPPEYETRLAILENKAILEDLDIKDPDLHDALDLIAQSIQNNIRELESAFTRVLTFSRLSNARITKSFAKEVLSEIYDTKARDVGPDDIKKAVASYFSIKVSDLESPARVRSIAYPRHIAIYLVRNMLGYSLPDTGKQFGDRDHTTVMNSLKKIQADLMKNKELQSTIDKIKQSLE